QAPQQQHLDDFWINHNLGYLLAYKTHPPRTGDALGYFLAALALRPRSPGVHFNVGVALRRRGGCPAPSPASAGPPPSPRSPFRPTPSSASSCGSRACRAGPVAAGTAPLAGRPRPDRGARRRPARHAAARGARGLATAVGRRRGDRGEGPRNEIATVRPPKPPTTAPAGH